MCAPCADHKPRPIREDARPYHPLPRYAVDHYQEVATDAYEDLGAGRQAAGSDPLAAAEVSKCVCKTKRQLLTGSCIKLCPSWPFLVQNTVCLV